MTGNDLPTHGGLPPGPPWPLDLLADLHAGVLEPAEAGELRRRVEADPDARATLAALDATMHSLGSLPAVRMPDAVAARIDAAIAAEFAARPPGAPTRSTTATLASPPAPPPTPPAPPAAVADLGAERARRRGRLIAGAGILTAAAAVAVVAVVNLSGGTTGGQPNAGATATDGATLVLSSSDVSAALGDALGATDFGPLAGAGRLDGCLRANGIDDVEPVGAREVTLDGKPGVLLVLPAGGTPPRWRMLVVGPDCGPGAPAKLADTTTG